MTAIKILDGTGATTFVETFQNAGGTTLMASVPINASGTAMVGQTTMANSLPVTIASDQSSLMAAVSFATVAATAGTPAPIAVKAGSGTLYGINLYCNNGTAPVFLKLYNLATGSVSSASSPVVTLGISPGAANNPTIPLAGVAFTTAITYQITKLVGATDTTAVAINDLVGWIVYL